MSLSKKTRFDVFKRDGFTCAYCGRKPPAVTLEVDHIIPRAEGGGDEIENLVTSCFDCNRGKRDGLLDDRAPVRDMAEQAELIKEREDQLRAYHAAREAEVDRRSAAFAEVWEYWFYLWDAKSLPRTATPWENVLRNAVDVLGVADVKEAMEIARGRFTYPSSTPAKYLGGILKHKIAQADGRVVPCTICGRDVILDRGDDPTAGWYHVGCREKQEKKRG